MIVSGYIYALRNDSFGENIYKIGMTQKNPNDRVKELSSQTGIPTPFELVAAIKVLNPREAEMFLHQRLEKYRVNGKKEFFKVDLDRLKIEMRYMADNFKLPIFKKIENACNEANDQLRQFELSFQKIRELSDYHSSFEFESEDFRNALEKYETLSITLPEHFANKIRTQAQTLKKSVSNFIKDILIDKLDK
jgi:hypothetical protein